MVTASGSIDFVAKLMVELILRARYVVQVKHPLMDAFAPMRGNSTLKSLYVVREDNCGLLVRVRRVVGILNLRHRRAGGARGSARSPASSLPVVHTPVFHPSSTPSGL
jgi:hypothetical protein